MSIFVKNVSWSQTDADLILTVPICGPKSIDDFVIGEQFLKINVRPYFYEVFFEHSVCPEQSSCKIFESHFKFQLKKAKNGRWHSLGKVSRPAPDSNDIPISIQAKKEIHSNHEECMARQFGNKKRERANLKRNEMDKEVQRLGQIRARISDTETALKNEFTSKVRIQ